MLAGSAPDDFEKDLRDSSVQELMRRVNVWIELRHRSQDEFARLTHHLLDAAGGSTVETAERVTRFLKGFKDSASLLVDYIQAIGKAANLEVLFFLLPKLHGDLATIDRSLQDELARTAGFLDVDLGARLSELPNSLSPLLSCWFALRGQTFVLMTLPLAPTRMGDEDMRVGRGSGVDRFLHGVFFSALATALRAEGDFSWIYPGFNRDEVGWLSEAIDCLEQTASAIVSGGLNADFLAPYEGASTLAEVPFLGNS